MTRLTEVPVHVDGGESDGGEGVVVDPDVFEGGSTLTTRFWGRSLLVVALKRPKVPPAELGWIG